MMLPPGPHRMVSGKQGAEGHLLVLEEAGKEEWQPSGGTSEVCLLRSLGPPLLRDCQLMVVPIWAFLLVSWGLRGGGRVEANFPADFTAQSLASSALFCC